MQQYHSVVTIPSMTCTRNLKICLMHKRARGRERSPNINFQIPGIGRWFPSSPTITWKCQHFQKCWASSMSSMSEIPNIGWPQSHMSTERVISMLGFQQSLQPAFWMAWWGNWVGCTGSSLLGFWRHAASIEVIGLGLQNSRKGIDLPQSGRIPPSLEWSSNKLSQCYSRAELILHEVS